MTEAWLLSSLAVIVVAAAWMFRSEAKADQPAPAPVDRAPPEHEVRAALADLRAALDRLQATLEKQHDHHEDELRAIQRQLDRIESSRRIEDALAGIYRQQRET